MLAAAHEILHPAIHSVLQKILDGLHGKGNVVSIFTVLRVEGKNQRQVIFLRFCCGGLPKQEWVMRMDDIQLDSELSGQ